MPYWHVDAGFAVMLLLLAAVDEGLGACFFGIMPEQLPLHEAAARAGAAFTEDAGFLVPAHFGDSDTEIELVIQSVGVPGGRVLLTAGGGRVLEAAPGRPLGLGVRLGRARTDHQVVLSRGDVLLLYTDGLVERPQEAFDVGLARLVATLERARVMDLESLCDLVLTEHAGGTRDDIALLAVRLGS